MAIINGTSGDDKFPNDLEGTQDADKIFGFAGNDALVGFGGNDELEGGAGADDLFGSDGIDYAVYRASDAGVYVSLEELRGQDGHAEGDILYSIEGAIGSAFKDYFHGSGARDIFYGEGGADQIGGQGGDDELHGGAGNDLLEPLFGNDDLYGDAGVDTASFYNYGSGVAADLASGTATGSAIGTDRLFSIENLNGTPFVDQLAGNGGANALWGSFSGDTLTGRGGADRFEYRQAAESTAGEADLITDFNRSQGDKIHLAGVDANEQASGDQAFKFIGGGQFTATGQLRFYQQGGDTVLEANTDAVSADAEMRIVLDGSVSMRAGDFVL